VPLSRANTLLWSFCLSVSGRICAFGGLNKQALSHHSDNWSEDNKTVIAFCHHVMNKRAKKTP